MPVVTVRLIPRETPRQTRSVDCEFIGSFLRLENWKRIGVNFGARYGMRRPFNLLTGSCRGPSTMERGNCSLLRFGTVANSLGWHLCIFSDRDRNPRGKFSCSAREIPITWMFFSIPRFDPRVGVRS